MKLFLVRALVRLLAWLPLSVVQAIGSLLGAISWLTQGRAAKVTLRNLELCYPEMNKTEREALARQSLKETAKTMAEMGKAWLLQPDDALSYIKQVNEEIDVDAAMASGKGIVTIVPHLGNWELLNLYAASRFPLNILYAPPKQEILEEFITNSRARFGTKVFPTDRRGVMAMFQALKKGEVVGILPDQEPPEEAGIFSPFFGVNTLTMTLVSKLAQKTGATVVCAYAKRLPSAAGFEVVIKPAHPDIYSSDLATSVMALNFSVEQCVEDVRNQYQWEYKRFKQGPGGKTGYYDFNK